MPSPDDTDKTPACTPNSKKSSGTFRPLLTDCPKCDGRGYIGAVCDLCNGGRKVGHAIAVDWILTHSSAPPPPDTEPER